MDDLESAFSMENAESSSPQVSQTRSRKQSVTTLLDITRANNIAIMLSRVKMGVTDIRKALLDVNDEALSVDDLKAIGRQLPTAEEIVRLKDFEDVSKLAKSDQYFYQIMDIPRLAERLDCMIYRRRLELDIEELRPELDIVRNAARELKSSLRFKRVLQAVLSIGNALNGSSFRGRAQGFKLDALVKMRETKTVKGGPDCPTLLHYLARALLRTDPSLVTFVEDMPHLEAAARVSVQTLAASITALVNGLDNINAEINNSRASRTLPQDHFVDVMTPFVRQNSASVEAMKNMGSAIEVELRSLLAYYGETPESPEAPKPEDFFALILSFSSSLQKAALEVHDKQPAPPTPPIIVEEPAAEEDSAEPTVKGDPHGLPPSARSSQGRAGGLSVGRGDLDQAIRSMRTGKRRARPNRPLSKIFFDGGRPQSRVFDT
ncbi:hypothetical protein EVG20_g1662 [Dentipellis fragilis]|uniref:FH2 domain-containing protein n=1 Tax=Dentipellis fragilis TaxID=205917 RepID=A0A4Y9ZC33_9AGAM|nr:hypothetical protein EVG20_g1662 [Dentipellis fragilis]